MPDPTFTSTITVRTVAQFGDDHLFANAARVSTLGAETTTTDHQVGVKGLIRYLISQRHASPFRHGGITFYIHAPIFVLREAMRHHVGVAWSEESARYKTLDPVFWVPKEDRPILNDPESKPARPGFLMGDSLDHETVVSGSMIVCEAAYQQYLDEIGYGIAREVARRLLPVSIYSSAYATFNPNALMNFLSLRTTDPDAAERSYPQAEIEDAGRQMEAEFKAFWPITHAAWHANGRRHL